MSKTKIDFLNTVELKVKDLAGEFIVTAVVSGASFSQQNNKTTFTVDSIQGFHSGDSIFIFDGTANSKFAIILEAKQVTENNNSSYVIIISGDLHSILTGATMKKSDAISYIEEALMIYSKIRPARKTVEITGDDSDSYDLPKDWQDGLSQILTLEYPEGLQPKQMLDENKCEIYLDSGNKNKIKFVFNISRSDKALINYTTSYLFDDKNPPVTNSPDIDFYCICNIAAYLYLMGLAAFYGQSTRGTISADNINYQNKTDSYRRLAKEYLGQAASWLGVNIKQLDGSEIGPAAASSSQGVEYQDEKVQIFDRRTRIINNRLY